MVTRGSIRWRTLKVVVMEGTSGLLVFVRSPITHPSSSSLSDSYFIPRCEHHNDSIETLVPPTLRQMDLLLYGEAITPYQLVLHETAGHSTTCTHRTYSGSVVEWSSVRSKIINNSFE